MNIIETLRYLRPGEEWTLTGDEYSGLTWLSPTLKPTEEELEEGWVLIQPKLIWNPVRLERNFKLSQSDWTQLSDVSIPNRPAWVEYRQKLRDVTKDFPTPQDVIWPVPPA
jgi:hypothetical protein